MNLFKFSKKEDRMPMSAAKKKKIKSIIAIILVIAVGAGAFVYFSAKKEKAAGTEINTATAKIGNIRSAISASGTIEPINMYEVTALVKGDVVAAYFEEGDIVEQDDILYQIDPTEMENTLERAKLSMERTRESYDDTVSKVDKLKVKAPIDGTITEMYVKKGDNVSNGTKICDIIDKSKMVLSISFNETDAKGIYAGQTADVILENSFYSTKGTVTRVSTGSLVNEHNVSVSFVDILVDNPGAINKGDTATALVGGAACNSAGTFDYYRVKTVTAEVSGEIVSLNEGKGNNVYNGSVIATIESESVADSLKDSKRSLREAEISLQNTYDQLDNYTIKAPIKGTIIEKNIKAGDKMDNSSNSKVMCVIADLSTIIFTINVDELDIGKIELNQKVDITADALPQNRFSGHVNNININGSTSNGVTTYPVEIVVDTPEGLLPGMNVNAEIVIAEKYNVLTIPVTAVMRGNIVYVKDDGSSPAKNDEGNKKETVTEVKLNEKSGSDEQKTEKTPVNTNEQTGSKASADGSKPSGTRPQMSSNAPTDGSMPSGTRPQMGTNAQNNAKSQESAKTPANSNSGSKAQSSASSQSEKSTTSNTQADSKGGANFDLKNLSNVPEGFRAVRVTTGLNDDNNIEIIDGLKEGDIVYVKSQVTSSSSSGMMGGMGAMGGGMPMGGMSGGMPGGMGGMSGGMGSQNRSSGQNRSTTQNRTMGGNR